MSTRIGEFGAPARARFDAALGFAWGLSVAATLWVCRSMQAMGESPMPGGWSMSAAWMPMLLATGVFMIVRVAAKALA
jgi:hypothetical protein